MCLYWVELGLWQFFMDNVNHLCMHIMCVPVFGKSSYLTFTGTISIAKVYEKEDKILKIVLLCGAIQIQCKYFW